ncbi:hypothetical protein PPEP_b1230 [Pseudoalteromonas peptidolytica F12-50-A1]|uniref:Uncharacterized protein n=1 Tax=Pseudoalteromonas peptidolytica F12-50-A1 TaxID=1315280 RepID=A0A8I0T778_9GAMM|nr:hypothetical protein [Pseudoalteromonas peptidolytica F12-50-A1]
MHLFLRFVFCFRDNYSNFDAKIKKAIFIRQLNKSTWKG